MGEHVVCPVEDLPPGSVEVVDADGLSVGVFNVEGEFYALQNLCPHRGGPLCEGRLRGRLTAPEPGRMELDARPEIVCCPWHGWEFDVTTGELVVDPEELRTRTFDVSVEPRHADSLDDVSVDTYSVSVEDEYVVLYV